MRSDGAVRQAPGATMRAAVLRGPGELAVEDVPVPSPGPRQVRVRVEGCGLCGASLAAWAGADGTRYPLPPGAPGHDGYGVVDEVGLAVRGFSPGQRVAWLGEGALAEYAVADAAALFPLPEPLAGAPFPGPSLGAAANVFRRGDVRAGQTVAVVGLGFLGAVTVALASRAGARVIALGRRPCALELARRLGADAAVGLSDPGRALAEVQELTAGRLCERVVEATGAQGPLALAGELARERGKLVVGGLHDDGPRVVDMRLWNHRGLDVVNAHERDPAVHLAGMRRAADAVMEGDLELPLILTHTFRLAELVAALELLRRRPDGLVKAVVIP